jgi:hypothetical protein
MKHLFRTAALALAATAVQADPVYGVIDSPIDLRADVTHFVSGSGLVYSHNVNAQGTIAGPPQSVEDFYNPPGEVKAVPRGPGSAAFVSALARSDGNGGAGVNAFTYFARAGGYEQLVAQASWQQSFEATGPMDAQIRLHLEVPALELGLAGVGPARSEPSATEAAEARATLFVHIVRADGRVEDTTPFDYGLHVQEYQLPLASGYYSNWADVTPIGPVGSIHAGGDAYMPSWSLDAASFDITLGHLEPGDTLQYTYDLSASGSTAGAERGYFAFVGDPFDAGITAGNLVSTVTPVPEPAAALLLACGLVVLRRRTAR